MYFVRSPADNEHQYIVGQLSIALASAFRRPSEAIIYAGVNVSDRRAGWKRNVRCPDVAVYLKGNPATGCGTHWFGGPDFAVEVVSPYDRSRDKLDFYAAVGVRELLIVDRKPWRLELYRLDDGVLTPAGTFTLAKPVPVTCLVLPFRFSLAAGQPRPRIVVAATKHGRTVRI